MRRTTDKYFLLTSFCSVVEHESFAKAAKKLGSSASSISKNIQQLEKELGQQLLVRTTRSMALTDAGAVYYNKGKQLLNDWKELEAEVCDLKKSPIGRLNVTLPMAIGQQILSPIIYDFMKEYPKICLELTFTHKAKDLINDDYDVAIRTWKDFPDSSLYKTDLIELHPTLIASPNYIAKYGQPETVGDLVNHKLLVFDKGGNIENKWYFSEQTLSVNGYLTSNDYLNLVSGAESGLGIANVYSSICHKHLASKKLVKVLPELKQTPTRLSAVYRQQRTTSAKLDCFLSYLENRLKDYLKQNAN